LMGTSAYQYVEPDWICYPQLTPNDPFFGSQWHHATIHSEKAWDVLTGSSSITIAITDTGVDHTHPDLMALLVPGYNAVDNLAETSGGQTNDVNGHGTHVAGDAAAAGNNGIGVSGVGWNFRIMPIRVSNVSGGGSSSSALSAGARWAADHGAKVIS